MSSSPHDTAATLTAHRVEATLARDGTLTLDRLPFLAGETVEVIVLRGYSAAEAVKGRYPLPATGYRYDRPTDPVSEDDWDVLQ